MADIRIFSYLPNPRVYKATITGRINGVEVEVVGASPPEMKDWLWDYQARPLTEKDRLRDENVVTGKTGFSGRLYKTDAFLKAHPYGTVPAAFGNNGETGIFESNSILRAVARLGNAAVPLYGSTDFEASRIDGFLDTALLFARDSQLYLLAIGDRTVDSAIVESMKQALNKYVSGIEVALQYSTFVAGDQLSIADICLVCELALFARDRVAFRILNKIDKAPLWNMFERQFPLTLKHFSMITEMPAVAFDLGPYLAKIEADVAERQA
jgi:glutathione S-transferase